MNKKRVPHDFKLPAGWVLRAISVGPVLRTVIVMRLEIFVSQSLPSKSLREVIAPGRDGCKAQGL